MRVTVRLFAVLRERRGGASSEEVEALPGETVEQLYARLFPDLRDGGRLLPVLYAVGERYVDGARALEEGDVVAFIPPLGGGAGTPHVLLTAERLELEPLVELVAAPSRGGICTFLGAARDRFEGRDVVGLHYEAYEEMALRELTELRASILDRWPGCDVALHHRLGPLSVGEIAVIVVAAAPHRDAAFAACRAGIDELKERVPIWKREVYADGSVWKANEGASQRGPGADQERS